MKVIDRNDIGSTPLPADNAGRVQHVQEIDAAVEDWTRIRTVDEVLEALKDAWIPAGRIYTVADIASDPQYEARGMLQEIDLDDGSCLTIRGVVPKLSRTPGGQAKRTVSRP
jgi:formyl-CoA transferase